MVVERTHGPASRWRPAAFRHRLVGGQDAVGQPAAEDAAAACPAELNESVQSLS